MFVPEFVVGLVFNLEYGLYPGPGGFIVDPGGLTLGGGGGILLNEFVVFLFRPGEPLFRVRPGEGVCSLNKLLRCCSLRLDISLS